MAHLQISWPLAGLLLTNPANGKTATATADDMTAVAHPTLGSQVGDAGQLLKMHTEPLVSA